MTDREAMQMALTVLERTYKMDSNDPQFQAVKALCTALAQPEKEWVGLTDEEITECLQDVAQAQFIKREGTTPQRISRTIEAKLKEKNT